jgi:hypothetical protein
MSPTCSQKGRTYDPIFLASMYHGSVAPQMIFNKRGLALIVVLWPWAVALKLARYAKQDPVDYAAVLHLRPHATWHPLDARWARAVDHGALLADGVYRLPSTTEAATSPAHIGCAQSCVSTCVARHASVTPSERDPTVPLAADTCLIPLHASCHDPMPDAGLIPFVSDPPCVSACSMYIVII